MSREEIRSYRDLRVWQEAMELAVECYRITREFPRDELFGLTAQIRRSASSIAANIAEGYGRASTNAYLNHLRIAQGSLKEVETHLLLSERVELVRAQAIADVLARSDAIGKMLGSLIRNVQGASKTG